MLWKTKNLFSRLNKKGTIFLVFLFSFLGLAYPKVSFAGWVVNLGVNIATLIPYWFGRVILSLAIKFTSICGSLVNWVVSPSFISYSYTNPATNPVIEVGLNVTQGLANMILVLILIYIAIAIMLQLAGYETKKLLVTFIIVALLVNFTPVICGLVVDASNIVMNFFTKDLPADSFAKLMTSKVEKLSIPFPPSISTSYKTTLSILTQVVLLVGFLFILSLILLIFALIFMLRYIAIWLLVILSPIAFVFYIIPTTKQYFSDWWKQFINWCFIGATCGFFLYLALFMVTRFETVPSERIAAPGISGELTVVDGILPYYVAVAFLIIGLMFGLKTSAIGASSVIGAVKARGRSVAGGTGRLAKRGAKAAARKVYEKGLKPNFEKPARWFADKVSRGASRAGSWGIPVGKKARLKPLFWLKWATPESFRAAGNIRPSIEKAAKNAEKRSGVDSGARIATQTVTGAEGAGELIKTLKANDAQDIFKEFRKIGHWKDMNDQEILEDDRFNNIMAPLLKHAQAAGMLGTILRRDPRLAKVAHKAKISGYTKNKDGSAMTREQAVAKAVSEARSEHIKDWEPETLEDPDVIMACLAQFERDRWLQVNRAVKHGQNTALESMDDVFSNLKVQKNLTGKDDEKFWKEEFRDRVKKVFGDDKYFIAVKEQRMINTSWRPAKSTGAPKKIQEEVEALRRMNASGRGTSPGSAVMGKMEETKKTGRLSKPRTGEEGKRRKNVPRTGIEGKRRKK